jgi:hypothetical protein
MIVPVLVDLLLFIGCEARGTSRTRVVLQADHAYVVPALNLLRYGAYHDVIDVSNTAHRKALMAQQDTMSAQTSVSGGMTAMPVGQGLDFHVAERGHILHRRIISARKSERIKDKVAILEVEDPFRPSPL